MNRFENTLLARQVIEETMYRYCEAIDNADLETLGNIFAAGALVSQDGTETRGPKAIHDLFAEMIIFYDEAGNEVPYASKACTPRTRHVTTNVVMDIDNGVEVANVRSYFTVYQTINSENVIIAGGRYHDRFERDPYGWHLIERRILIDNLGDMSHHLKQARSPA